MGVKATDRWGGGELRNARRIAYGHLADVGAGTPVEMLRPLCLHVRKSLSDSEMQCLSAEWLAIPARDEFSEDGKMEARL